MAKSPTEKKRWLRLCNRGLEGELEEKEVEEDPPTRELREIEVDRAIPNTIEVELDDGVSFGILSDVVWLPPRCEHYTFGHNTSQCSKNLVIVHR
ncbi:hypothetical protein PVK06_001238 [Gossypium arboreum]|uniref:Uncharacterized protein n=1 Tax=Gossypium arboreum TaxID=29729 RepID=A0ABR0R0G8_GOSAR|nr:hypothetical protein PVK06_001238 [Gossypium arboreum]